MKENWTGERLETFITNETMLEHLHRYAIAMQLVKGKLVLDIACGEGYGAHLLSQCASHVTGIDIDDLSIKNANKKYTAKNLTFKTGSALKIPAENHSFDVITCFETIEHLSEHDTMIKEFKRILKPGGLVLISTPDKSNYSDKWNVKNQFHKKELYETEFKSLLNNNFLFTDFYRQTSYACSIIQHANSTAIESVYTGSFNNIQNKPYITPTYWMAIASDTEFDTTSSSLFFHHQTISELTKHEAEAVKKTITYRLGHIILTPIKLIRAIFKK